MWLLLPFFLVLGQSVSAGSFETNAFTVTNPPPWLKVRDVEEVTQKVQDFLEWDIRKVPVYWYSDAKSFQRAHGLGPTVMAAAKPADGSIHMGPRITSETFARYFGHELTHVILAQKYKKAIPSWLEEGLANYVGGMNHVDYVFLRSQGPPKVTSLTHAFRGSMGSKYHYAASTAVMEMIAKRCSIKDLLQLSVGKKLETYLQTYCEIKNLDEEFAKWIEQQAKSPSKTTTTGTEKGPWWKNREKAKPWWKK